MKPPAPNPSTPEATKHTPGPIYADIRTGVAVLSTKRTPACLDGEVEGEILRVGGDEYCEGFSFLVISKEREANINLWAAAPDMLAALKELVRVVGGTLQGYGILESPMKTAEAAISKAEAQ